MVSRFGGWKLPKWAAGLAAWQALGYDPGTTVHGPIPGAAEIVAMAAKTLGVKQGD